MSNQNYPLKEYSVAEEKVNIVSHLIGAVLSIIAFPFLVLKALEYGQGVYVFSFCIYGISLILLYAASSLFHATRNRELRYKLNVLDHVSIFILIAGTYMPYSFITLQGNMGNVIFGIICLAAFGGVVLKLFFTGKYRVLSTIMYVLMGWVAIFAFKPLYVSLAGYGFTWLLLGGIAYTLGAVLYSISKIKFNHAVFHVFVLLGSLCHFVSIYFFVLP
ncbi:hemolysin III family protein [Labilibacter sediminis]|nr:hemolysin III family protein [Labilibacter sediminis]